MNAPIITDAEARLRFMAAAVPAFRDRFDFSEDKHWTGWAEMCDKAADALLKKWQEKKGGDA